MSQEAAAQLERLRKAKKPAGLDPQSAIALCERLFGVQGVSAKQLDSYDDMNFVVTTTAPSSPSTATVPHKVILKVHNAADSTNIPFIQAQNSMIDALSHAGILVPQSIPLLLPSPTTTTTTTTTTAATSSASSASSSHADGLIALEPVGLADGTCGTCAVRLLHFVEAPTMDQVPAAPSLFAHLGAFMAQVAQALAHFDHPAFHRSHLWDLRNLSMLRQFVHCITDPERLALVTKVGGLVLGIMVCCFSLY